MAIIQEDKIFYGGVMDSDSAPEHVAPSNFLDALNIRSVTNLGQDAGYSSSIEGTKEVTLPYYVAGDEILRSAFFKEINKTFIFVKGVSRDCIVQFDPQTKQSSILIQGDLDFDVFIKDVKLVGKKNLLWNDAVQEVRSINIERALNGEYSTFVKEDLSLMRPQPLVEPIVFYTSIPEIGYNKLNGKLFQFRSQFIYRDKEESAWSAISERPVPVGGEDLANNVITISQLIPENVSEVITAMRIGMSDWQVIDRSTREELNVLPTTPVNPLDSVFVKSSGAFTFKFTNSGLYEGVPPTDTDLLNDVVPNKVNAIEVVNKNVILLGGTTEGYPRPINTKFKLTPGVQDIPNETIPGGAKYTIKATGPKHSKDTTPDKFDISFSELIYQAGDLLQIKFRRGKAGIPIKYTLEYMFTAQDTKDGMAQALANACLEFKEHPLVNDSYVVRGSRGGLVAIYIEMIPGPYSAMAIIDEISVIGAGISGKKTSIHTLKQRSSYQTALAYYDKYGRPYPLVTGKNFTVDTLPVPSSRRGTDLPTIHWDLGDSVPPVGAQYYRLLLSRNTTHLNWRQVLGFFVEKESISDVVFDVTSLKRFADDNQDTPLKYSFTKGDRLSFVETITIGETSKDVSYDVEIKSFEIKIDEETKETTYLLHARKPDGFKGDVKKNYTLELYTPLGISGDLQTNIYFEVGETYFIENGAHQTTSGVITKGDVYWRDRFMKDSNGASISIDVEDPHFSDLYKSNYYNYGRPRTYYDTQEGDYNEARIRHSREYIKGLNINQITRFFVEEFVDYDYIQGAIQYLCVRGNRLIVLQEKNIGYVGVERSILEGASGDPTVAISSRLLNGIDYTRGIPSGIGSAINSYVEYYGDIYFIDPYRETLMRAGLDGVIDLSGLYSNKLRSVIRDAKDIGNVDKLTAFYNEKFGEYILGSPIDGISYVYSDQLKGWSHRASFFTKSGFSANSQFFSSHNGKLYEHTFEGADRSTIYGVFTKPSIKFVGSAHPSKVKTLLSLGVNANSLMTTPEFGIETDLGHVSDLMEGDFDITQYSNTVEGVYSANFLRAYPDLIGGDILKGRYAIIEIEAMSKDFELFSLYLRYNASFPIR